MSARTWPARGHPRRLQAEARRDRLADAGQPWLRSLALLAIIVMLTWLGFAQLRTPEPAPLTAPATAFSAERAMVHLDVIAADSRAIGMPGHDATRDYLVAELTAMGLQPQIQTTSSALQFEGADAFSAGMVSNVIVRIPGTANTGAIAINAHYDGGATGPAAGDNGVGVVATLEVVRAILAGEPLANDLIVVFSDGEENGDLGAAAFTQDHPWAADVRIAINFEAQGTGGPAMLYATSDEDGWLTGEYLAVAPAPSAYSLLPELVRALPGRLACDLEDYLLNGSAGLGFVIADDTAAYHTVRDSVANIDRGSVQQEGDNTLAAVRHFGRLDLTEVPRSANRVYFTILPGVVIQYGGGWVLPLAAVVTLLLVTVVVLGRRRRLLSIGGLAVGMVALLLGTLMTVAVVEAAWFAVKATNAAFRVHLVGPYQTDGIVLALSLLAIALMAALYRLLQKRVRALNLTAGAMLSWALLMWITSLAAPGASYYLTWPLLVAMLPLAWTILARERVQRSGWNLAVLTVALLPAAFLIPGIAYQTVGLLNRMEYLFGIVGNTPLLGLWAIVVAPLVGLFVLHLNTLAGGDGRPYRWLVPGLTALAALLMLGWATVTSGFDAEHPRPNHIAYELDADTGAARFVSLDPELDAWTAQFFPDDPATADYELQPGTEVAVFAAPTAAVPLEPAAVRVVADETAYGVRTLTFRITSPRGVPDLQVAITAPGEILTATLDGRTLDLGEYAPAGDGELWFGYAGVDTDGIELTMTIQSTAPVTVALTETSYGLPEIPGLAVRPRSDAQMPAAGFPPDATVVRRAVQV
jgi:hypothetical protein